MLIICVDSLMSNVFNLPIFIQPLTIVRQQSSMMQINNLILLPMHYKYRTCHILNSVHIREDIIKGSLFYFAIEHSQSWTQPWMNYQTPHWEFDVRYQHNTGSWSNTVSINNYFGRIKVQLRNQEFVCYLDVIDDVEIRTLPLWKSIAWIFIGKYIYS